MQHKNLFILKEYLEEGRGTLSFHDTKKIGDDLKKQLEANGGIIILDFQGLRALSPSFAYNCFGKVYDTPEGLEKLLSNIQARNDERNLFQRVTSAVQRRIGVLVA